MRYARTQSGDTLVEVVMALAILSIALTLAYSLAGLSLRIGQGAQERTQAAEFAQQQAEALRNFRDTSSSWASFKNDIGTLNSSSCVVFTDCPQKFYMVRSGSGSWRVQTGTTTTLNGAESIYTLAIAAKDLSHPNKLQFDIAVKWSGSGSAPLQTTTIATYLVNIDGITPR